MLRAVLAASLVLAPATGTAQDLPAPVQAQIDDARADCESFEGGDFSIEPDAVQHLDLTGDGALDWVVDETFMRCTSSPSMYCGTGGCGLSLIVGDVVTQRLSKGWEVVDFYRMRAVLLDVHGSLCGGINPTPCLEALAWDFGDLRFTSLAARDE